MTESAEEAAESIGQVVSEAELAANEDTVEFSKCPQVPSEFGAALGKSHQIDDIAEPVPEGGSENRSDVKENSEEVVNNGHVSEQRPETEDDLQKSNTELVREENSPFNSSGGDTNNGGGQSVVFSDYVGNSSQTPSLIELSSSSEKNSPEAVEPKPICEDPDASKNTESISNTNQISQSANITSENDDNRPYDAEEHEAPKPIFSDEAIQSRETDAFDKPFEPKVVARNATELMAQENDDNEVMGVVEPDTADHTVDSVGDIAGSNEAAPQDDGGNHSDAESTFSGFGSEDLSEFKKTHDGDDQTNEGDKTLTEPPLFELSEGKWACPDHNQPEDSKGSPPFKPRKTSVDDESSAPKPVKKYEIPKKSKNAGSRLSLADIAAEEPSAELLEQMGLPSMFNMNRKNQEQKTSPSGPPDPNAPGYENRDYRPREG